MKMQQERSIKLWDLPVRLCHWGFALLVPLMWWTAENGEMGWHLRLGVVLLGLLVFRIIWGFIGSPSARFATFLKGPREVWTYLRHLRTADSRTDGSHNPAGGWSALALLCAMSIQVAMGLFAGDPFDGSTGPLQHLASVALADRLTEWHEIFFYVVATLAIVHVLAIAFYLLVKKDNLVTPMITGRTRAASASRDMADAPTGRAIASAAIAASIAIWIWLGGPPL